MCVNGDSSFQRFQQFISYDVIEEFSPSCVIRHFVLNKECQPIQVLFEKLKNEEKLGEYQNIYKIVMKN